ncbi:MAG: MBL fold metallo-hydrolase [Solirubrobacteraceae bacterium]|nr:MBL fold metallo-hydrolase [Solirubrobacteraceae bacterium]
MTATATAIDTQYLGQSTQICCWRVDEHTIVDPGPTVSLQAIRDELAGAPLRRILVTHIHLDHSGGVGALLREHPDAEVWVSKRGARHLIDPARLIASAEQVYGGAAELARLFGEIVPVPEERVRIVAADGEEERDEFVIAETPGHAKHHVSFLHTGTGDAYVGDTASVRLPGHQFVLPMTTPPDTDQAAWNRSLDVIAAWKPRRLMLTHFGAYDDVALHLARAREGLRAWAALAAKLDADLWGDALAAAVAAATGQERVTGYATTMPAATLWHGLQIERERLAAQAS